MMSLKLKLKIFFVIFLSLFSSVLLLPTFVPHLPDWFTKYVYRGALNLGLDLKGGVHLVLRPDFDKALQNQFKSYLRDLGSALKKIEVDFELKPHSSIQATLVLKNGAHARVVKEEILKDFKELSLLSEKRVGEEVHLELSLSGERITFIQDNLVNQVLETIRNRIDQFGVAEPLITRQGKDKIVIQLPGVKDPERAIRIIGQTAQLEFKLVDDETMLRLDLQSLMNFLLQTEKVKDPESLEEWRKALRPYLPADTEYYFLVERERDRKSLKKTPILLKKETLLTGEYIRNAQMRVNPDFNEPYVWVQFNDRGAKIFEAITSLNVGRRLAIVLDEVVRSAPVIREKISGGEAQITGSFTFEEAQDLAVVLRAGALPAPIEILSNITIGPSLGRDSIEKGITAGLFGASAVILFTVLYYKLSGVIAIFALLLNIYYLLALLSAFQATLTLPGIAGIILSIGMGIDSNVLIFERIRDEFRVGRTGYAGIFQGYSRAFWTIFDAHLTVLITSIILFLFGTGPIRGFAVTLSVSIIVNLFTAIFVSKLFYEVFYEKGKSLNVQFWQIIGQPNFDFMKWKSLLAGISAILLVAGIVGVASSFLGKANLGIDFTGGTILYLKTEKEPELDRIREVLSRAGFKGVSLQDVRGEKLVLLKFKSEKESPTEESERLLKVMLSELQDYNFQVLAKEEIGGVISSELKVKVIYAVVGAIIGLILYLSFRFNFYFGLAAGLATLHDVLAVFGLFYLWGREINLLLVTALLTIAGYSLTDTVVIFDRIREVIQREEKLSFTQIINKGLNEVLSRTIITTITTLFGSLALLLFGGVALRDFALALTLGFLIGTYSSIFIASPLLMFFHKGKVPELKPKEDVL